MNHICIGFTVPSENGKECNMLSHHPLLWLFMFPLLITNDIGGAASSWNFGGCLLILCIHVDLRFLDHKVSMDFYFLFWKNTQIPS